MEDKDLDDLLNDFRDGFDDINFDDPPPLPSVPGTKQQPAATEEIEEEENPSGHSLGYDDISLK